MGSSAGTSACIGGLFQAPEAADSPLAYFPAPREDSALGVASGLAVGGRKPVVLMQNSGLALPATQHATLAAMVVPKVCSHAATGSKFIPAIVDGDTVGQSYADKSDLNAGLIAWQDALIEYGDEQGFTVNQ